MPYDPITAAKNANFVQFTYNMFKAAPTNLRPPVDPGLAAAGYELLYYLSAHDFQEVRFYGYLAASTASPGNVVLAVRGTQTVPEWILDFDALPLPYLGKGFVVAGFRNIAESFQFTDPTGVTVGNLTAALAARNAKVPISNVTVLGHSLGAALATLAAAQIKFSGNGIGGALSLFTYASPRVGLLDFMTAFNHAVPDTFRVWNTLDIVPQVPTIPYVHVGQSKELKQQQSQIQKLQVNPSCEHSLQSYQWLLDPGGFSIGTGCAVAAPAKMEGGVESIGGAAVVPVNESALGAAALARGLQQEM
jgi:hypothetical protein